MKKLLYKTLLIVIFTLCFIFAGTHVAHADISLGVYPPILQIQATPPANILSPITVQNLSDTTVDVDILVKPFTQSADNTGAVQYLPDNQGFPGEDPFINEKMDIFDGTHAVDELTLAPKQEKKLVFHIDLPKDEPASDYYFSILFISKDIYNGQSTISSLAGGIAINVLLSVGPTDKTNGYITDFSAPLYIQKGPIPFHVSVENTSKHFITPQGTITIKNMFGQTIGQINLLPVNILSGTDRFIPDDKSNDSKNAIWPEKFLFGPYAATLTIALSSEGPLFKQTVYFLALPVEAMIAIFFIIIAVTIITVRVRQKMRG
ncbi:MAG: hypothetical protein ACREGI_05470 [Candidatus Levyibacteriota bacterium]